MDTAYKRTETRIYSVIPVLVANRIGGNYSDGVLLNHSACGMYLETDRSFFSGTPLFIKTLLSSASIDKTFMKNAESGIVSGRVTWCHHLSRMNTVGFGMGINYTSEYIDGEVISACVVNCDSCGQPFVVDEKTIKWNAVFVCKPCSYKMKSLPKGELKSNIENILMGNIF